MKTEAQKLVVAMSSRALFDLDESHAIFERDGVEAYRAHQLENEDVVLMPGTSFHLATKLLSLNADSPDHPKVEIILLSKNSPDTGLRIFNSIAHYGLDISRAAFTSGKSTHSYLKAFSAHLFLSANQDDVRGALEAGFAAATILPSRVDLSKEDAGPLRIAFDGDAVIFSDEAERIYRAQGLSGFTNAEVSAAKRPIGGGPFKSFLAALHAIQGLYPPDASPIRTGLVTARCAPTHERVIRTLREWGIRIDEALFLGGMPKGEFLAAFGAHIFFDDQRKHCDSARVHVPTGHVPHGIANESVA